MEGGEQEGGPDIECGDGWAQRNWSQQEAFPLLAAPRVGSVLRAGHAG